MPCLKRGRKKFKFNSKLVGNEKQGGRGGGRKLANVRHYSGTVEIEGYLSFENMQFHYKNLVSVSGRNSKINKHFIDKGETEIAEGS